MRGSVFVIILESGTNNCAANSLAPMAAEMPLDIQNIQVDWVIEIRNRQPAVKTGLLYLGRWFDVSSAHVSIV